MSTGPLIKHGSDTTFLEESPFNQSMNRFVEKDRVRFHGEMSKLSEIYGILNLTSTA